jgi:tRNA threonylcarbamoyladenosine biosynthesis protein TsaB
LNAKVLKLQITNYQLQIPQLLLAVDTSGKNGSLALARLMPGQSDSEISVLEVVPLAGGAFSAQLVPQIAALLKKHGYSKTDLGAFAVASGPGSFTGLRVGLAAVKALAEALQKPIVAISLLEAVARRVGGFSRRWMRAGVTCMSATTNSSLRCATAACTANAC